MTIIYLDLALAKVFDPKGYADHTDQGGQRRPSRRWLPEVYRGKPLPPSGALCARPGVWIPLNKARTKKRKRKRYQVVYPQPSPAPVGPTRSSCKTRWHRPHPRQSHPPTPFQFLTILGTSIGAAPTWGWIEARGHFWDPRFPRLPSSPPQGGHEGSVGGVTVPQYLRQFNPLDY